MSDTAPSRSYYQSDNPSLVHIDNTQTSRSPLTTGVSPPINSMSPFYHREQRKCLLGVCAMDKKLKSKPMRQILDRLRAYGEFEILIMGNSLILDDSQSIEQWPMVDCLISFTSSGFPLNKVIEYVKFRRPFCVNDLPSQSVLLERADVYQALERAHIPTPRHLYAKREYKYDETTGQQILVSEPTIEEHDDWIAIDGQVMHKPLVEKPFDGDDHNVYIYYPSSRLMGGNEVVAGNSNTTSSSSTSVSSTRRQVTYTTGSGGGGSRRLFRKVGNRSSRFYPKVNSLRREGSYIYEELLKNGKDLKVYTIGPGYAHGELRKSPVVDGIVERDLDKKELRLLTKLTEEEKAIAAAICVAFKQNICGFDMIRWRGKSYVIDVNGWSFVKGNMRYYDKCARILRKMCLGCRQGRTALSLPRTLAATWPPSEAYTPAPVMEGSYDHGPLESSQLIPQLKLTDGTASESKDAEARVRANSGSVNNSLMTRSPRTYPVSSISAVGSLAGAYGAISKSLLSSFQSAARFAYSPTNTPVDSSDKVASTHSSAVPSPATSSPLYTSRRQGHAIDVQAATEHMSKCNLIMDTDNNEVLRSVVAVFRHADRTVKQKVKMRTKYPALLDLFPAMQPTSASSSSASKPKNNSSDKPTIETNLPSIKSLPSPSPSPVPTSASSLSQTQGKSEFKNKFNKSDPSLAPFSEIKFKKPKDYEPVLRVIKQMIEKEVQRQTAPTEEDLAALRAARIAEGLAAQTDDDMNTTPSNTTTDQLDTMSEAERTAEKERAMERTLLREQREKERRENQKDPEYLAKLMRVRTVLEKQYPGIKLQLKPTRASMGRVTQAQLVCKWGGQMTHAGIGQARQYAAAFWDDIIPSPQNPLIYTIPFHNPNSGNNHHQNANPSPTSSIDPLSRPLSTATSPGQSVTSTLQHGNASSHVQSPVLSDKPSAVRDASAGSASVTSSPMFGSRTLIDNQNQREQKQIMAAMALNDDAEAGREEPPVTGSKSTSPEPAPAGVAAATENRHHRNTSSGEHSQPHMLMDHNSTVKPQDRAQWMQMLNAINAKQADAGNMTAAAASQTSSGSGGRNSITRNKSTQMTKNTITANDLLVPVSGNDASNASPTPAAVASDRPPASTAATQPSPQPEGSNNNAVHDASTKTMATSSMYDESSFAARQRAFEAQRLKFINGMQIYSSDEARVVASAEAFYQSSVEYCSGVIDAENDSSEHAKLVLKKIAAEMPGSVHHGADVNVFLDDTSMCLTAMARAKEAVRFLLTAEHYWTPGQVTSHMIMREHLELAKNEAERLEAEAEERELLKAAKKAAEQREQRERERADRKRKQRVEEEKVEKMLDEAATEENDPLQEGADDGSAEVEAINLNSGNKTPSAEDDQQPPRSAATPTLELQRNNSGMTHYTDRRPPGLQPSPSPSHHKFANSRHHSIAGANPPRSPPPPDSPLSSPDLSPSAATSSTSMTAWGMRCLRWIGKPRDTLFRLYQLLVELQQQIHKKCEFVAQHQHQLQSSHNLDMTMLADARARKDGNKSRALVKVEELLSQQRAPDGLPSLPRTGSMHYRNATSTPNNAAGGELTRMPSSSDGVEGNNLSDDEAADVFTYVFEEGDEEIVGAHQRIKRVERRYAVDHELCGAETLLLLKSRWDKLITDFYDADTQTFDATKIPDVYDSIKYDCLHNADFTTHTRPLYTTAKRIADFVVPHEYGVLRKDKWYIGASISQRLWQQIIHNLDQGVQDSPPPPNRVSLYFSSESHIHALRNVLLLSGIADNETVATVLDSIELNYLSHAVFRLYEDLTKHIDDPNRFYVNVQFSPGAALDPFIFTEAGHILPVSRPVPVNGRVPYDKFRKMFYNLDPNEPPILTVPPKKKKK